MVLGQNEYRWLSTEEEGTKKLQEFPPGFTMGRFEGVSRYIDEGVFSFEEDIELIPSPAFLKWDPAKILHVFSGVARFKLIILSYEPCSSFFGFSLIVLFGYCDGDPKRNIHTPEWVLQRPYNIFL